jgi:hypothetical protein
MNLLEARLINRTGGAEMIAALEYSWLCRYPKPLVCQHDNGPEFSSNEFQFFLLDAGIKTRPVAPRNPQSNGIIEQVHKTVGQVIRTLIRAKPPNSREEAMEVAEEVCALAVCAVRLCSHSQLNNASPGSMAFGRDMLLNIPFMADLVTLQNLRQQKIDLRLLKANSKRRPHDFQVGEQVMIRQMHGPSDKLKATYQGPFPIKTVHTNGSVTVRKSTNVRKRFNIRHLCPYTPAVAA